MGQRLAVCVCHHDQKSDQRCVVDDYVDDCRHHDENGGRANAYREYFFLALVLGFSGRIKFVAGAESNIDG